MKSVFAAALLCISASSHASCLGSMPQCEAQAWQQYNQPYQQQPQPYQPPPAAQPQYGSSGFQPFGQAQYQPIPVNENGFDRYGHYHPQY